MKFVIVQNTCNRCGFVNETEVAITYKEDTAVYRCDNCKFIIFSSWMEDNLE